ncbi:MAG: hypothetical protein ACI943_002940 [Gammaproteobacteria bacterium]|jgi:hypothetical protein
MKNCLLLIAVFIGVSTFAQTNLSIDINHKLNGEDFAFFESGTNNLDQEFTADRLEYYLSKFEVTHDNGEVTEFEDVFALVDASGITSIDLGSFNGANIEMLSFSVGVDEANNHADPASWPSGHPLAPQFPSMHWGWAAGYRFLAMEGVESSQSQTFELHGLGDNNYFRVELPTEMTVESANTSITVRANTEEILYNISVDGGVISHGDIGAAKDALINMQERVFEISTSPLGLTDAAAELKFNLFPNPTDGDFIQLNFDPASGESYRLEVSDVQGRIVLQQNQLNQGLRIELGTLDKGVYLFNLISDRNVRSARKVIVN